MARTRRSESDDGVSEFGSIHSQGAPRGLLRFYALLSISRKPMCGYDLMKEIEIKTDGAWRPGPGAVYPVLQKLLEQGHIAVSRESSDGQTRVYYEITREGLSMIADAKKMMKTSSERMSLMRPLFVDLMEPEDLVKFALGMVDRQGELIHTIVDSDKAGVSEPDRLFVLRQYKLNLERELTKTVASIDLLERRNGREVIKAKERRRKGRS